MQMPTPGEHHQKLHALVGDWRGEEKFHPSPWDPNGGVGTSRCVARMDLDGFYLITDYTQERDGRVSYRGHGVYGYDLSKQKYQMYWFDVMGIDAGAPALGTWVGDTLVYSQTHQGRHGRYTYQFRSPDEYTFMIEQSHDGESWKRFLEGIYRRSK